MATKKKIREWNKKGLRHFEGLVKISKFGLVYQIAFSLACSVQQMDEKITKEN